MKSLLLLRLIVGLSLAGAPGQISHANTPSRPNIIVFLVDDYDKPETSPYGGKVLTPNLDRLAREGRNRGQQSYLWSHFRGQARMALF
jgi:hypothetical protein